MFSVDALPGATEALAILDVLEKIPGSRCWITFQCTNSGTEDATGTPLEVTFARLASHPGFRFKVLAVGVSCIHPKDVSAALKQLNKGTVLLYYN